MSSGIVKLIKGDITALEVGAVVNAANSALAGGGGVDGAIHRAAGPSLNQECMAIISDIGRLPAGKAVITGSGNMPCHKVIHTVGPVWHGGKNNEEALLSDCYRNSLALAKENGIKSIAFPNISTGIYGFPKDKAAPLAIGAVKEYLANYEDDFDEVIFCCFDEENYVIYEKLLEGPDN